MANLAPKTRALCLTMTVALFAATVMPLAAAADEYPRKPYVPCPSFGIPMDPYGGWVYAGDNVWKCYYWEGPGFPPSTTTTYCYGGTAVCWVIIHEIGDDPLVDDPRVEAVEIIATQLYQTSGAPHPAHLADALRPAPDSDPRPVPLPYAPCPGFGGDPYGGWIYAGGGVWKCYHTGPDVLPGAVVYCYGLSWTCWFVYGPISVDDDIVLIAGRSATEAYQAVGAPHPASIP